MGSHQITPLDCTLNLTALQSVADKFEIPLLDLLLISANVEGISSDLALPRARMQLQPARQNDVWQLITPADTRDSPFVIRDGELLLQEQSVARVIALENDDVVLTYLRAGGRSLTLNTNSRSTCTGCVFCPNVIEDAADSSLKGVDALSRLLEWTCADNDWTDLSGLEVITVCSGCFRSADAAATHLIDLRKAARKLQFAGRLHLLSSVVRERDDLRRIAQQASPFHLTLTLECFSRRDQLLKATKATLDLDAACSVLNSCRDLEITGDFTYIAGLDPLTIAIDGLSRLSACTTTFPRIQVYQAHNDYMRFYRTPEAACAEYYAHLRTTIEPLFAASGLRPKSWENYRPLWYTEFCGAPVGGPRI